MKLFISLFDAKLLYFLYHQVPNSSAGNLLWQTEHSLMSLCNTKILKCTDKGKYYPSYNKIRFSSSLCNANSNHCTILGDPLSVGNELRASGVVLCFGGVFY